MKKEQIKQKAQEICEKNKRYGVECSSLECYLSAMEMAEWLLQNIQIVKLHNACKHDLFEKHKFQCLEEQRRQLLLSLKDYIKMEEELTDYGTIVKMEIKVIK